VNRFKGFADDDGKFFRKLAKNNERTWFLEHKSTSAFRRASTRRIRAQIS
jgi:uncharacterized protein (DUF2461 family)